jgi:hypothetical protein
MDEPSSGLETPFHFEPKNRNAPVQVALCSRWPAEEPEPIDEMWVFMPVGDDLMLGYRVEASDGLPPSVVGSLVWRSDSPPWRTRPRPARATRVPSLWELGGDVLTERQALQAWREICEMVDGDEKHLLHPLPRRHGFDRMAPLERRPDDLPYAGIAAAAVACRDARGGYARALARVLSEGRDRPITPSQARKFVSRCRDRTLLDADRNLTTYARWLLDGERLEGQLMAP